MEVDNYIRIQYLHVQIKRQRLRNFKTFFPIFQRLVEYVRLVCLFLHSVDRIFFASLEGWRSLKNTSRADRLLTGASRRSGTFTLSLTLMPFIYITDSIKLTLSLKTPVDLLKMPGLLHSIWSGGCKFLAVLLISAKNLPHKHTNALGFSHIYEVCIIFQLWRLFSRSHLDLI